MSTPRHPRSTARLPAWLLGIGFGAFIDGIVLHQTLQWHHMISADPSHPPTRLAGLEANTLADGLFHLGAFGITVAGVVAMYRASREGRLNPPWAVHVGLGVAGWGAFNVVEGVINHHLLGVHHVRDDIVSSVPWDIGFLALSAVLLVGGVLVARRAEARAGDEPR